MKGSSSRAPGLIKRIIEALSSKTNELRTRVMIFMLLHRDQSLLMDGMQSMLGGPHHRLQSDNKYEDDDGDNDLDDDDDERGREGESFIIYVNRESATVTEPTPPGTVPHQVFAYTQENLESNYGDLTHTLFKESEEEMELTDNEEGHNNQMMAVLEDENVGLDEDSDEDNVDQAADLFIQRFRRQMRMQKQ